MKVTSVVKDKNCRVPTKASEYLSDFPSYHAMEASPESESSGSLCLCYIPPKNKNR